MKAPEPKKVILLANCFDTLKYEIEAEVPHTLEEGKDLEVNLSLKTCLLRKTALTGLLRKRGKRKRRQIFSFIQSRGNLDVELVIFVEDIFK